MVHLKTKLQASTRSSHPLRLVSRALTFIRRRPFPLVFHKRSLSSSHSPSPQDIICTISAAHIDSPSSRAGTVGDVPELMIHILQFACRHTLRTCTLVNRNIGNIAREHLWSDVLMYGDLRPMLRSLAPFYESELMHAVSPSREPTLRPQLSIFYRYTNGGR